MLNLVMKAFERRGQRSRGVDFFRPNVGKFLRVSEVFVMDGATKTFSFVAFFVEGAFWGLVYM
jgi:hypothetical protein